MVLSMWHLVQIFFTSKFTFFFETLNPTNWNWSSSGQQIGGGLLIANHLDWSKSDPLYYTLFFAGAEHRWTSYLSPQIVRLYWVKTNFLRQTSVFELFFFIQFYCEGSHTEPVSTAGDPRSGYSYIKGNHNFWTWRAWFIVFWEDIYNV
jgi:hypothetical protein